MEFIWRRKVLGLKARDEWLKWAMKQILSSQQPLGWEAFRCSNGWLAGFKTRFAITARYATNIKQVPIATKLPLIKAFHVWLLRDLQMSLPPGGFACAKYGRFGPSQMFAMDQMPLPFVLDSKRTLNSVGEPVFILQPKGGLDKRQATIHLCIRAEGPQIVRIALIFRGAGQRINDAERAVYRSLRHLLCVYFQPNAWADELFMFDWLEQFVNDTALYPARLHGLCIAM